VAQRRRMHQLATLAARFHRRRRNGIGETLGAQVGGTRDGLFDAGQRQPSALLDEVAALPAVSACQRCVAGPPVTQPPQLKPTNMVAAATPMQDQKKTVLDGR
jgi:hypothetical protein